MVNDQKNRLMCSLFAFEGQYAALAGGSVNQKVADGLQHQ